MKILILGAGQVGTTAAYHLAREEANEVTIVDSDASKLRDLQDRLDVRTVVGHASFPDVLARAGAEDADMIIALTNSDEVNMIACQIAYTVFQTPTKIARIRAAEDVVKALLTRKADANAEDKAGDTPLHIVVRVEGPASVGRALFQVRARDGSCQGS